MSKSQTCPCCQLVAKAYVARVGDERLEVCHACRSKIRLGLMLCESCQKWLPIDDVEYGPNPYVQEIHGEDQWEWLCGDCYHEACMDI